MDHLEGFPVLMDADSFFKARDDMENESEDFEELDDAFFASVPLPSVATTALQTESDFEIKQEPPSHVEDNRPQVPSTFQFPFEPYDIQLGFMQNLYKVLDGGKCGIFESPTGTGKSLSLICGALTWLRDFEQQQRQELEDLLSVKQEVKMESPVKSSSGEPDWILEFAKKKKVDEEMQKIEAEQQLREKRETRLEQLRSHLQPKKRRDKRKKDKLDETFDDLFKDASLGFKLKLEADSLRNEKISCYDDDVVLDEYFSDDESILGRHEEENEDEEHITKIYYCSRTHSQLSQFVREVQKSPFSDSTRLITLGSRQNACVNEAVKRLSSLSLMNDRCLDLQRNKSEKKTNENGEKTKRKKTGGGCPYFKQEPLQLLKDKALIDVLDIEQLVVEGKQSKACPYYGSRLAVPAAQIVVLPYQMLLHKSTRESCGIQVKDQVVIIDEAHNLMETISSIHSVTINGTQLTCAYSQLSQYQDRYKSRLKAKNLMYIRQILFILSAFIKVLGGKIGQSAADQRFDKTETRLLTINDFLFDAHLDNLNLFKVIKYCQISKISMKLNGFVEKSQPQVKHSSDQKNGKNPSWALSRFLTELSQTKDNIAEAEKADAEPAAQLSSPLMHIESFLDALTTADRDGRIVINRQGLLSGSSIRFLLLNPSVHFNEIVKEARAVVVAGGTMQPVNDFKDQLFRAAGICDDKILEFSCGHVIAPHQLLPIALARGSSGTELDFTYQKRNQPEMMAELGRVVYNACNLTPGGVVCFFPSYEFEKTVYSFWEKEGFLSKISAKKKIFREPKKANQVDRVLNEYSSCIQRHSGGGTALTGSIIFSVVGGKLSEGINFSDDLCRCVIMVGLPYPNIRSPELKEKMDYLNATMPKTPEGQLPGQQHYENLCMKAVNQSIGRAIRHQSDFAAILLLDQRYLKTSVQNRLPGWIKNQLKNMERFGPTVAALRKFFTDNR